VVVEAVVAVDVEPIVVVVIVVVVVDTAAAAVVVPSVVTGINHTDCVIADNQNGKIGNNSLQLTDTFILVALYSDSIVSHSLCMSNSSSWLSRCCWLETKQ